jgi:hypothetical protein
MMSEVLFDLENYEIVESKGFYSIRHKDKKINQTIITGASKEEAEYQWKKLHQMRDSLIGIDACFESGEEQLKIWYDFEKKRHEENKLDYYVDLAINSKIKEAKRRIIFEQNLLNESFWYLEISSDRNNYEFYLDGVVASRFPKLSRIAHGDYHCSFYLTGDDDFEDGAVCLRYDDNDICLYAQADILFDFIKENNLDVRFRGQLMKQREAIVSQLENLDKTISLINEKLNPSK